MLQAPSLFRVAMIGLAASTLFGCAGVPKSATVAVAKPDTMVLARAYTWPEAHSTFGRKLTFEYTLVAGNYIGSREDSGGTYYEGEGNCLRKKVAYSNIDSFTMDSVWTQRCGVYVSKREGAAAKVYYYNLGTISQLPGMPESPPLLAPGPATNPNNVVEHATLNTPGLSPMQAGLAGGIGAALGGIVEDAQNEARLNNAQFLFYQPEETELKSAFGIR